MITDFVDESIKLPSFMYEIMRLACFLFIMISMYTAKPLLPRFKSEERTLKPVGTPEEGSFEVL